MHTKTPLLSSSAHSPLCYWCPISPLGSLHFTSCPSDLIVSNNLQGYYQNSKVIDNISNSPRSLLLLSVWSFPFELVYFSIQLLYPLGPEFGSFFILSLCQQCLCILFLICQSCSLLVHWTSLRWLFKILCEVIERFVFL